MASRIIHLAIADCISKKYRCKDKNRLELGSVLPDAVTSGNSHLKISISGGTKKTYDLTSACGKCEQEIYSLFHSSDCLDERTLAWRRR